MAYIPGNGFKKPSNSLENPIYPDIRKGPPEFKNSGKYWRVDSGRTMLDTQDRPDTYEHAVLVQSRAYNSQTAYGVSSHKTVVNENFRPPLIRREDLLPLSRTPRETVVPRINPGTHENYQTQNNRPGNIDRYVNDRVKDAPARVNPYKPFDSPQPIILPDLEKTLPIHSTTAGYQLDVSPGPYDYRGVYDPYKLIDKANAPLEAGVVVPEVGGPDSSSISGTRALFASNIPDVSATSGMNAIYTTQPSTFMDSQTRDPLEVSATSGSIFAPISQREHYTPGREIIDRSSTSDTAGFDMRLMASSKLEGGTRTGIMDRTPHSSSAGTKFDFTDLAVGDGKNFRGLKDGLEGSMTTGFSTPFRVFQGDSSDKKSVYREEKKSAPVGVKNVAPQFSTGPEMFSFQKSKVKFSDLPNISYYIPTETKFKQKNADGSHIHYRTKSDAFGYKSYDNKGYVPTFGTNAPQVKLKGTNKV